MIIPAQSKPKQNQALGLTLIELLIVVLIIAILSGSAIFYVNTDSYRLKAEANNLKSTLEEVRAEAIKRNTKTKLTVYHDRYKITDKDNNPINIPTVYIDENLKMYTAGNEEFQSDTTRDVTFTSLGRTTFNFHVRLREPKGNFYKICAHFGGRTWLEYNVPGTCSAP